MFAFCFPASFFLSCGGRGEGASVTFPYDASKGNNGRLSAFRAEASPSRMDASPRLTTRSTSQGPLHVCHSVLLSSLSWPQGKHPAHSALLWPSPPTPVHSAPQMRACPTPPPLCRNLGGRSPRSRSAPLLEQPSSELCWVQAPDFGLWPCQVPALPNEVSGSTTKQCLPPKHQHCLFKHGGTLF